MQKHTGVGLRLWTPAGIYRLRKEREDLERRIREAIPRDQVIHLKNRDREVEAASLRNEVQVRDRLEFVRRMLLIGLSPMERPRHCRTVHFGHEVRVKYLDDTSRKKRGDLESFIVGGPGEIDTDSVLRTYSSLAPMCQAVLGKRRRARVEVIVNNESYLIQIVAISIPEIAFAESVSGTSEAA